MAKDVLPVFTGPVEMDETYIGGQRKNKRLHIRRIQGKRGHGTDKLPIVGILCRTSGQVYVEVLPKRLDVHAIMNILEHRVLHGALVYTDGFKMYRMLPKHGFTHEYVNHHLNEYVRGEVHTNSIE
jgi:transposase-like protein